MVAVVAAVRVGADTHMQIAQRVVVVDRRCELPTAPK
jgi:hypothetical protein